MKMRTITIAVLAVLALTLAACGGGGGGLSNGNDTSSSNGDTGSSSSDVVEVVAPSGAANSGWGTTEISAPADTPFTIHFVNEDAGIPHDVRIYEGTDATGTPVFAPAEMVTGPGEADYEIPGLPAGTYTFTCMAHPTIMLGTLSVA